MTTDWVVTPELEQQIVDRLVDWWCENKWELVVRPGIHLHQLMEDLYEFGVSDGRSA